MEFYKVIDKRKSIREYETKQIPKSKIIKIIEAATKAASGANTQPWKFYIIQTKKKRDKIVQILRDYYKINNKIIEKSKVKNILGKFYQNLGDAPCFIFVYYKKMKGYPNPVLSASATLAAGNLMNAAAAEGLGTCWINSFAHKPERLNRLLNIPKDEEIVAPLIIGYPKKGYKPLIREKRKLSEILKFV